MKGKLYIIPGFGENTQMPAYKTLITEAKRFGFNVIPYNPRWDYNTASTWINEFKLKLGRNEGDAIVLGFSFGAYIAFCASRDFAFKKIISCSLAPYFNDELGSIPEASWKFFGKRRKIDFTKHSFPKEIKNPATFMVGDKEIELAKKSTLKRHASWSGPKKMLMVPRAEHDLSTGEYLRFAIKEIKNSN
jgi:hypothetical protein